MADTDTPAKPTRPPRPGAAVVIEPIYVDLPTAAAIVSLSESVIQQMSSRGEFPKPRELAKRRVGYLLREIREWAEQRPTSTMLPPPRRHDPT